ncbi:MAG: bifunctional nuclease domain-containing protein [Balneolaceae bacterium]
MSSENIEMEILGLSTSPSSGGAYALILTEKNGTRRLPIIIGTFEAQAIALELENIKPPRPMTHDLLKNALLSFNSQVDHVVVSHLSEGTFFAKIVYQVNGENVELDARPSDAIALCIRFKAPIYVHKEVLKEAGIESEEKQPGQTTSARAQDVEDTSGLSEIELLEKELKTAIDTENYEKAAKLRDQINKKKG